MDLKQSITKNSSTALSRKRLLSILELFSTVNALLEIVKISIFLLIFLRNDFWNSLILSYSEAGNPGFFKTLKIISFILSDGIVKIIELNSAIMTGSGTALSTIGTPL